MNQNTALKVIAALCVAAMALVLAAMAGASGMARAIFLVAFVLTIVVMKPRRQGDDALPVMTTTPEAPDFQDMVASTGLQTAIDGLVEPMMVVQRGKVVLANVSALSLLGKHIVGEDVRIAIRHPAVAERLASVETLDSPVRLDIVGLGTRNQRWAMQLVPFGGEDGADHVLVHLSDQSVADAADRMRGDFVANASHELRTPLAAILGFVETLQDPKAGGDAQTRERFLSILEKEARRMQQLVDDLMSLSRIEADKHRLPTTPIDLPELTDEVLALCRQNLGERGGDIVVEIADDLEPVQGDRMQIGQLLHNLVSNSAKYGRASTPIVVKLSPAPSSMVRLEVTDQGEGIPSDHLPRLTERFYRVDSGRSRAIGGTGLGLAIVKHIVERHRGRLEINSSVGKGTRVTVLLPQAERIHQTMDDEIDRQTVPVSQT